jgi:glycosyltransferase involved in cell wall biosynthesis
MKILVVGNYYYPEHMGGVEIVSHNLIKHYRGHDHMVRWVAADVPPKFRHIGEFDVPLRSWNIAEEKLGFPHPIPFPNTIKKLYTNIKWCDIVHLQDSLYPINIFTFIFAKILRRPILITQYAKIIPYTQFYKQILQIIAYRTIGWIMFNLADRIVFITPNVRDAMSNLTPNLPQDVVPLGVDTDFYEPALVQKRSALREKISGNVSTQIVLFVGRMVERKGVNLIRPLIGKYKDWHWVFVGRPDDFNPSDWNLPNLTHLQGISESELRDLYAASDLLVHPSLGEGITLTVSECMACGTPVIISEESLHEIAQADWNLFFPIVPETKAIEQALVHALENQQRLNEMRIKIREYAITRLSWAKVAEQYLSILKELTSRNCS